MGDNIRQAISDERYVFGAHADERLRERRMVGWQIVAGMATARLIREKRGAKPNPNAEFELVLADGTPVKVIWAWISAARTAS
jgi:hypothetical protein